MEPTGAAYTPAAGWLVGSAVQGLSMNCHLSSQSYTKRGWLSESNQLINKLAMPAYFGYVICVHVNSSGPAFTHHLAFTSQQVAKVMA